MSNPGTPELTNSRHQALVGALMAATGRVTEALRVVEVSTDPGDAWRVAVAHELADHARRLAGNVFDEVDAIFKRRAAELAGQSGAPDGPTTAGDENHG